MIPVESWEIVYGDGSRFTSGDGTWAEAPAFGVFAVVYYLTTGCRFVHMEQHDNSRYEWWPEGVPTPECRATLKGMEAAGNAVKFGLWVANDQYFKLFDAAHGEVT